MGWKLLLSGKLSANHRFKKNVPDPLVGHDPKFEIVGVSDSDSNLTFFGFRMGIMWFCDSTTDLKCPSVSLHFSTVYRNYYNIQFKWRKLFQFRQQKSSSIKQFCSNIVWSLSNKNCDWSLYRTRGWQFLFVQLNIKTLK